MSTIGNELGPRLAARLKAEREGRGWSLADLALRSGVSKAMLSKIERGEASPTAALLGRLSGALGLTLSALLARAEGGGGAGRLARAAAQPLWTDPGTGYLRRQLSPACDIPLELTHVELPAGATVSFPAASYAFIRQMVWVLEGDLTFAEGEAVHELAPGDCLALGPPADCAFSNRGPTPCRYLVAVLRQG